MASSNSTESYLGDVRHSLDLDALTQYLQSEDPVHFQGPFTIKQFGFGQSNPSYQLKDSKSRKYVLRKQPSGKLLSSTAHRVDREFYMIKALKRTGIVPVPNVYILCQDKSVIGTEFYIMEFMEGRIFHDPVLEELGSDSSARYECWKSAMTTLAALHSLDPVKTGLPDIFFPKGGVEKLGSHYPRQVVTLKKVEEAQAEAVDENTGKKLGLIPHSDDIVRWLGGHLPALPKNASHVSIVHGDFKIDNLVFHPKDNRVIAILDWELCTLGHPLADLGNILQPYSVNSNIPSLKLDPQMFSKGALRSLSDETKYQSLYPGLPTLNQAITLYGEVAGWDPLANWKFAVIYAHFRLAVISHGIAARYIRGQASSKDAKALAKAYPIFAELAYYEIDHDKGKL